MTPRRRGVRRASLACALALLATPLPAAASIVVILASPKGVLIGADSRRTTDDIVFHDACKIRAGTRGAFAAIGSYPETLLERLWRAGEELANSDDSPAAHLDAVIALLTAETVPEDKFYKGAIAFVSWSRRGPMVASARFTTNDGRYQFARSIKDWRNQREFVGGQVILSNVTPEFGERDLMQFVRNPRSFEVIERVIAQQAERDGTVGGPTDLLRIDASGVRWHRQKPECQEEIVK